MCAPMAATLYALLILSLAALVTAHVTLAAGLLLRGPWWRGVVALLAPPLAPFWGLEAGLRWRAGIWIGALVVYVIARIAAGY
jgi:hypothetical protein